ncbi:hypothetical protein AbraIFM66951_005845 [Aspergillus brasiliensis]|nr:hypothetical protein AbraIFM66951_005845 [Aspergillus brasiliensis]
MQSAHASSQRNYPESPQKTGQKIHISYASCSLLHSFRDAFRRIDPQEHFRHDREFIYLYEAQIPVEFLEMLDKPTIVPASTNGPIIYQRKIPFRPFETFPARVRAETLASAIVDTTSIPKNGAVK